MDSRTKVPALIAGAVLLAGCAAAPPEPALAPDHPANPRAAEAPPPAVSHTLDVSADEAADAPATSPSPGGPAGHLHGHAHHAPDEHAPPASAPAPGRADHGGRP